jgi:hypothetical protein
MNGDVGLNDVHHPQQLLLNQLHMNLPSIQVPSC